MYLCLPNICFYSKEQQANGILNKCGTFLIIARQMYKENPQYLKKKG